MSRRASANGHAARGEKATPVVKPLDPEDPMALVSVQYEHALDDRALTEMAWCFVEEYARMGWKAKRILRMFRSPLYRGPHLILCAKGEEFVRRLVEAAEELRPPAHPANKRQP